MAPDPQNRRSSTLQMIVRIVSQANNSPQFSGDLYVQPISEGTTPNTQVYLAVAQDPDNEPLTYSIIGGNAGNVFRINATSGMIFLRTNLDRETRDSYDIQLQARDRAGLTDTMTVRFEVTDINDNTPQFRRTNYTYQVNEGAPPINVGRVEATDGDAPNSVNSQVYYWTGSDKFRVDRNTGQIISTAPLDYETQQVYVIVVEARDLAPDSRTGSTIVTVRVQDVQDFAPVFVTAQITRNVPETDQKLFNCFLKGS
ncbi:cadherin-99C-like [Liolophura sinensis]|uniref:cadherin-99C-like n=1 Tax=Liolophura sinensis TaxID=3198878 RepID=UPI0031580822